jgi:hypothetical protein
MNERIKELAEQAGVIPGVMGLNRFTYFDTEKFAELIVRECANHIMNSSDRYRKEYFADKILIHFGMK